MEEQKKDNTLENTKKSTYEIPFIEILVVMGRWKKVMFAFIMGAFLVGMVLAFVVERDYVSIARVLPPKDNNPLGIIGSASSLTRSLSANLTKLGKNDDPYNYLAILKSRTVLEQMVNKFQLIKVYRISDGSMEKALKMLTSNMEVDWTEDNTLEIRVWDADANRSAQMANYFYELLNETSTDLQVREGRNNRLFIEERLNQNRDDLQKAEAALTKYQEKNKMIVFSIETSAKMSSFANIFMTRVKKEIEVKVLQQTVGSDHPEYHQALLELEVLNEEIAKFPKLGTGSMRLVRDVLVQQKILELLTPLYEQAKINEHKDTPTAYLLDVAQPGEKPDRPKRLAIVGISVFAGLVMSILLIFIEEHLRGLADSDPENYQKLKRSLKEIFSL